MKKNRLLFIFSIIAVFTLFVGCQADSDEEADTIPPGEVETTEEMEKPEKTGKTPIVTMTMENGDEVTMELYPDVAPNTVNNFIALIEDGFYDGLIFHRVIPGFMIQGGDPAGNGTGDPGYAIKGEFASNGFENELSHEKGVLSMARSQSPDSAGSQFFIMVDEATHLDGDYAAFGKVVDGMDLVDEIVAVETGAQDKPKEDQVIESMTVELEGYEAKEPEKMK